VIKNSNVTVSVTIPDLTSSASSQPLPSRHPDGLLQEAEQFTPPVPLTASLLPSPCETKGNAPFFFAE